MYFPLNSQKEPFQTFFQIPCPCSKHLSVLPLHQGKSSKVMQWPTSPSMICPLITSLPFAPSTGLCTLPLCALYAPVLGLFPHYSLCLENLFPDC